MSGLVYGQRLRELLDTIDRTQIEPIRQAASLIVDAATAGGCFHLMDTGHMLTSEAVGRAGGLMLVTPLSVEVKVENPARRREGPGKKRVFFDEIQGFPDFILAKSNVLPGDVLMVSSVSGKNVMPVEVALKARENGIKVIALTSVTYSRSLAAEHPSGKRLYEAADLVIDNCGVAGDAVVSVPGMPAPICPTSGITAAYIMWTLQVEIVEAFLAKGVEPHVYLSNHLPGADEYNRRALAAFAELGY